jgi:dipeptidyl aminopeptidase/acylaminoacyl peptidase
LGQAGPPPEMPPRVVPPSELPGPPVGASSEDVWLAFDTWGEASSAIFVMRADGSSLRQLSLGPSASDPAFSPNGKALAFAGAVGIEVLDLTTGTTSQLTTDSSDGTPAWSPDGRLVAFTRDVSIYVIAADGSGERLYIQGPPPGQAWYSNYGHPAFTMDGQSLLFDCRGAVDIGDVDGSSVRTLFSLPSGGIAMVGLSPSGAELALVGGCDDNGIDVVALARAGDYCGADAGGLPSLPSLDGGSEAGNPMVMDSGSVATNLDVDSQFDTRAAWGANGLIAYVDEGWLTVSVVPASGGNSVQVTQTSTTGGAYVDGVAWSPPGTVIP